jgi:hypothetical protein
MSVVCWVELYICSTWILKRNNPCFANYSVLTSYLHHVRQKRQTRIAQFK